MALINSGTSSPLGVNPVEGDYTSSDAPKITSKGEAALGEGKDLNSGTLELCFFV